MRAKKRLMVAMVAIGLGAACAAPAPPPAPAGPTPDEMVAAADALDQRFVEAFNAADVDAMMALYWDSPDVVSFPPDAMQVRGPAALRESIGNTFAALPGGRLELTEHHQQVAGDVVIGWGLWKMTVPGAEGAAPTEMTGRYTDVKALRNGKWVYLLDHASAPLPAPAS